MITIYWGTPTMDLPEGIRADAPISILQKVFRERKPILTEKDERAIGGGITRCPAIVDELINIYGLKSYFDYTLIFKNDVVMSPDYNQEFYDSHFLVKDESSKLYFFRNIFVFFTEEPSLEMSYLPAYMEDNNVANNTIMVPGKINIGKYFRPLVYDFYLKQNCSEVTFNRKEIYSYVKFHTKKKLKFKQFSWTPKIQEMDRVMMAAKRAKYDFMNLDYYYNIFDRFNFKKKILKDIKDNLCKEV